ncbi:MAG: hypothetical protein ACD_79C00801G0002 [uncultured bacterium]|nr:MAG: hypothetical protein ACD_79C00801G0002 [uncultured bacterium]
MENRINIYNSETKIKPKFKPDPNIKVMDQVKQVLRYHHYAFKTEQTYCVWIIKYLKFYGLKTHPKLMGKFEIEKFLTSLAVDKNVAASTQRQALNALIFLYRDVLDLPVHEELEHVKSRKFQRPPTVMTQGEVKKVLSYIAGTHLLMAKILYAGGLRLMECVRLRVQDIDFDKAKFYIRGAKGGKDRLTLFPKFLHDEMRLHIEKVKRLHEEDLSKGFGAVYLPHALDRKYQNAEKDFRWQYVFPSKNLSVDPRSGIKRRHHVLESGLQKAVQLAVKKANILKPIGCHTFRHSFATHLLENNVNIRTVQELLGHSNVKTTEIYTHVMDKKLNEVVSPLEMLFNS